MKKLILILMVALMISVVSADMTFDCIEENAKSGLVMIGLQGGDSVFYIEDGLLNLVTTTYVFNEELLTFETDFITPGFSDFVKETVPLCVEEYSGKQVREDSLDVIMNFRENSTELNVSYYTIDNQKVDYNFNFNARIKYLHNMANTVSEMIVNGSYFEDYILDQDNITLLIQDYEDGNSLFMLTDNLSFIDEEPFTWAFGVYERPTINCTDYFECEGEIDCLDGQVLDCFPDGICGCLETPCAPGDDSCAPPFPDPTPPNNILVFNEVVDASFSYIEEDENEILRSFNKTLQCPEGYNAKSSSIKYSRRKGFGSGKQEMYNSSVKWVFESKETKLKKLHAYVELQCEKIINCLEDFEHLACAADRGWADAFNVSAEDTFSYKVKDEESKIFTLKKAVFCPSGYYPVTSTANYDRRYGFERGTYEKTESSVIWSFKTKPTLYKLLETNINVHCEKIPSGSIAGQIIRRIFT